MKKHLHPLWLIGCTFGLCCNRDFGGEVASLNSICCIGLQLCYGVPCFLEGQKKCHFQAGAEARWGKRPLAVVAAERLSQSMPVSLLRTLADEQGDSNSSGTWCCQLHLWDPNSLLMAGRHRDTLMSLSKRSHVILYSSYIHPIGWQFCTAPGK